MGKFSGGGFSHPDFVLFCFFLIQPIISIPLNSLVLRHNYAKPPSISRYLYLIVFTIDLVACPYLVYPALEAMWIIDDPICKKNAGEANLTNAFIPRAVYATFGVGLQNGAMMITGIFMVVRYFQIKYPLRQISTKIVKAFLFTGFILPVAFQGIFLTARWPDSGTFVCGFRTVIPYPRWGDNYVIKALPHMVIIVPALCFQIAGQIATLCTIIILIQLHKAPDITGNTNRRSLRGTIKIILLNTWSLVNLAMSLYLVYHLLTIEERIRKFERGEIDQNHSSFLVKFFLQFCLPLSSSIIDPLAYLLLTKEACTFRFSATSGQNTASSAA